MTDHEIATEERVDPVEFWERRYAGSGPVWSGRVNRTLAEAVADLPPGRSLDLGCGEGGDVLWLAERGWEASGLDLSSTAIERARIAAADRGLPPGRVRFAAADLADWAEDPERIDASVEPFDLITASFLQSPVELPRQRILRAALRRLAPGGRLVLIAHASPPPWAPADAPPGGHAHAEGHADGHTADGHSGGPAHFHTPESELGDLGLGGSAAGLTDSETPAPAFEVLVAETRSREATGPNGETAMLEDSLVVVRRAG